MEMEKIYPGLNRVLIQIKELPKKEDELLVVAESPFIYGEIVAVGAIKDKEELKEFFNKGDKVYLTKNSGININLPVGTFRLVNVQEILVGEKN